MHIDNGYPLYCAEARQRMYYYPPPYWSNGQWWYATPWLWYDGDKHGGSNYTAWQSKIVARMNIPAPVTITMWGTYTPLRGTGTIYAKFRNDSTATINGRVIWVITEDSIYYSAPNGDLWHNHVARDYLPNQNGQTVSIPAGDSVTISQSFTIQSNWNANKCQIVTWLQNDVMTADSIKNIWQGAFINVPDLTYVAEGNSENSVSENIIPIPNPCVIHTRFSFTLPAQTEYSISIFDISGRKVWSIKGRADGKQKTVEWNLKDQKGVKLGPGVYLYRFESGELRTKGKIVVR